MDLFIRIQQNAKLNIYEQQNVVRLYKILFKKGDKELIHLKLKLKYRKYNKIDYTTQIYVHIKRVLVTYTLLVRVYSVNKKKL